jgi:G:T/U-mismatch repair DNA glycosylase
MRQANIDRCIMLLQEITGANGAVAGANPAVDQGKGTTELAIQGSQNTLEYLFYAKQSRFERVCRALVSNIKANDPDLAARTMQVKVEQVPTQEEWFQFYQNLAIYGTNGLITPADDAAIREVKNLKEARRLLASRAKRKRLQDMEDATAREQSAAQVQMQSAQSAEQGKQATLQLESQLQMQMKTFDRETQLLVIQAQAEAAERTARITADSRLQGVGLTVEGANQREQLKAATTLEATDIKAETTEYVADSRPAPSSSK